MKECLTVKRKKFLFWRWTSKYYEHDWAYSGELPKLRRKCLRCSRREILIKTERYDGENYEDWRQGTIN